jgi:hypothetical protein
LVTTALNARAKARRNIITKAVGAVGASDVVVDSGAFALRGLNWKKGQKFSPEQAESICQYHFDSCRMLHAEGVPLSAVAELDLPHLFGSYHVERWRELYAFPFQDDTGIPVIFGWHQDTPYEYLLEDSRVSYVGFGVLRSKDAQGDGYLSYLKGLILQGYKARKRVHGFALTQTKFLKHLPFYSIDSVTWQVAYAFGDAVVFNTRTGDLERRGLGSYVLKESNARKLAKNAIQLRKRGSTLRPLDVIGRTKVKGKYRPDPSDLFHDQALAFHKMEKWYTRYWKLKGVDWETQLDGT